MRPQLLSLCVFVAAFAAACSSTGDSKTVPPIDGGDERPIIESEFEVAVSRDGNYLLGWRPVKRADVPVNEYFEIEAYIAPTRTPNDRVQDARLVVSAWMPGHGHGMVTTPKADPTGEGTYIVKGMLFHMGGFWQLFFDVVQGQTAERIEFELNL